MNRLITLATALAVVGASARTASFVSEIAVTLPGGLGSAISFLLELV